MDTSRLRTVVSNVRRCWPGAFCVVSLTHGPFLLLLFALLSTLFQGGRYLTAACIGAAFFLVLGVFAALPMSVALSGYFIALSKGRSPRLMSIFGVFSDMLQYRHALKTTLSLALRMAWWLALCFLPLLAAPFFPAPLRAPLPIVCALAAAFVLLNRLLSYAFTVHFAWEYPYLTPREAVCLSAHVTRGRLPALLRTLAPLLVLLLLTLPSFGLLSMAVLPFFYTLLAECYLHFKQCEGVVLPSPKEYADV